MVHSRLKHLSKVSKSIQSYLARNAKQDVQYDDPVISVDSADSCSSVKRLESSCHVSWCVFLKLLAHLRTVVDTGMGSYVCSASTSVRSTGIHFSTVYGKLSTMAQIPRIAACRFRSAGAYLGDWRAGRSASLSSRTNRSLRVITLCRGERRIIPDNVLFFVASQCIMSGSRPSSTHVVAISRTSIISSSKHLQISSNISSTFGSLINGT